MADPTTSFIPKTEEEAAAAGKASGKSFTESFGNALALGTEELQRLAVQGAVDIGAKVIAATAKMFSTSADTMDVSRQLLGVTTEAFESSKLTELMGDRQTKLTENMLEQTRKHGDAIITMADGSTKRAAMIYPTFEKLSKNFVEVLSRDAGLYTKGMDGMTNETLLSMSQAANAFSINQEALTEITRRELSATGKIQGDMLKEFQSVVIATSNITGETYRKVSADVQGMLTDFTHFGMMSMEQMGSLSAYVGQVGLSIGDVGEIAGKFQSFDGAVSAMSNLAAATGVTLDTMELFKLANTDPEGFARSLKQQLSDQGLVYEEMDFIQKKMVAQSFGVSPQKLQALLSDQLNASENFTNQISEKSASLSEKDVTEATNSLVDYTDAMKFFEANSVDVIKAMNGMSSASLENAKSANIAVRSYSRLAAVAAGSYSTAKLQEFRNESAVILRELDKEYNEHNAEIKKAQEESADTNRRVNAEKVVDVAVTNAAIKENAIKTAAEIAAEIEKIQKTEAASLAKAASRFDNDASGTGGVAERLKISVESGSKTVETAIKELQAQEKSITDTLGRAYFTKDSTVGVSDLRGAVIAASTTATAASPVAPAEAAPAPAAPAAGAPAATTASAAPAAVAAAAVVAAATPININLTFAGSMSALADAIVATSVSLAGNANNAYKIALTTGTTQILQS